MTGDPITKVYDADGELVHSCADADCAVSWDGYDLASGVKVAGASELGDEWDVSVPGVARRKPPTG